MIPFPVFISPDAILGGVEMLLEWMGLAVSKSAFPVSDEHKEVLAQRITEVTQNQVSLAEVSAPAGWKASGYSVRFHPLALTEYENLKDSLTFADEKKTFEKKVLDSAQALRSHEFLMVEKKEVQIFSLQGLKARMYMGLMAAQKQVVIYYIADKEE